MSHHYNTIISRLRARFGKQNGGLEIPLGKRMRKLAAARFMRTSFNGKSVMSAFEYGFAWKRARGSLSLAPETEANPHAIIVGSSGYGKSTLLKGVISSVARSGRSLILFDGHNEHESLIRALGGSVHDAAVSNINILALDGLTVQQRIEELTSLLSRVYNLGYLQRAALNSAIYYTYRKFAIDMREGKLRGEPTISDLVDELSIFIANSKGASERSRLEHVRQRVSALQRCMPLSSHMDARSLASGVSSFSLRGLGSSEAKLIYMHEIVRRLYGLMRENERERGVRLYVVIDESKELLEKAGNLLTSLVNEGRKFGYALVIVTNSSAMLPKDIIANSATFIAFRINEPGEINYISSVIARGNPGKAYSVRSMLDSLKRNQAIVACGSGIFAVQCQGAIEMRCTLEAAEAPSGTEMEGTRRGGTSEEHDRAVGAISARLGALGVKHYVTSGSGPDIVAYKEGKVAIEYETGRKNFDETSAMIAKRGEGYARTMVFVNDLYVERYKTLRSDFVGIIPMSELGSFSL